MFKRIGSTAVLTILLTISLFADSRARIVRLSDVEGTVQVDRNTGQGFEKAFLNMPISQGMRLQTQDDGRAEVEFEDGSTFRLTPDSQVDFDQLSLRDSGAKVSSVEIENGTAYLNFRGKSDDEFTLDFGDETLTATRPAHLRVRVSDQQATLAVLKGEVSVSGPSGSVDLSRRKSATFDLSNDDQYTVADNYESDPYDSWDKQQQQYQDRYMSSNSYTDTTYNYGMSDLNYYGNYVDVPGYGFLWQPYFTGYGWDPYANGAWVFYPGYGYNWVSAYPWGWAPYHSGSWVFLPGQGWFWQPGGAWTGWNVVPRFVNPPARYNPPKPPPKAGGTVVVNHGPTPPVAPPVRKMTIRNDSAGLGVPRGSVLNLGKVSQQVNENGSAIVKMHTSPVVASAPAAMPHTTAVRPTAPTVARPAPAPHIAPAGHVASPHVSSPHVSASPHK